MPCIPTTVRPLGNIFITANAKRVSPSASNIVCARHDGEYRWAIDAAAPRLDQHGGFLGYIGSVIDITERKQAEQTQQLLIDELNHRVKNTLASVQAMVQHTLRRTQDPEEFVASFAGRIQSLARVHSLLSATTWKSADLRELIRDQLLHGAIDETRITRPGAAAALGATDDFAYGLDAARTRHQRCEVRSSLEPRWIGQRWLDG